MPVWWNNGYWLEAKDRIGTIQTMIEQILSEHPAIKRIDGQKDIDKVVEVLEDLYQRVGRTEQEGKDRASDTCPKCGCQIYDPFGRGTVIHDVGNCCGR